MKPTNAVTIKAETNSTVTVAGWGVIFDGSDLEGEQFVKDTDFWLDRIPGPKPVLYDHGMNGDVRKAVLGMASIDPRDEGLWIEAELDKHNRYIAGVMELAKSGALGWSSGAVAHLVERDLKSSPVTIKSWPVAEFSLTPTPAEPRTIGVREVRSLIAYADVLKGVLPETPGDGVVQNGDGAEVERKTVPATVKQSEPIEDNTMTDETQAEAPEVKAEQPEWQKAFSALADAQKSTSEQISQLLKHMQETPAIRKSGYFTEDGGTADPDVKSFGDFLLAVRRGDTKRITQVYKSRPDAVKDMQLNVGTTGGYLVPEEFSTQLLQMAAEASQVIPRVTQVPVTTESGSYPVLDQFVAPTAGSGATGMAAGVTAATTAPGTALTETTPNFEQINWRVNKVGGYVEVENELAADSPQAIETLLSSLFGIAISAKNERNILRGTGAGEPEGVLNASAAIGIAPDTNNVFAYADAAEMVSRFKRIRGNPVWLVHPGILPDIYTMESSGGGGVYQANYAAGLQGTLLGYPIITSEHLPQDDNSGCVILADLSAYLFFVRSQLSIAFSEHAAFTSDKGTWKFSQRNDGQSWLRSAITLADPQGSFTCSPFVYLND